MISKEEIEKAKKILYPLSVGDFITWFNTDGVVEVEIAVENLLEAYKQLESKEQKIKKKLEEKIEMLEDVLDLCETDGKIAKYKIDNLKEEISDFKEILEIMKGEDE